MELDRRMSTSVNFGNSVILPSGDDDLADIYRTFDGIDDRSGNVGRIHEVLTWLRPEGGIHPTRRRRDDPQLRPFGLGFQCFGVAARAPFRGAVDAFVGLAGQRS